MRLSDYDLLIEMIDARRKVLYGPHPPDNRCVQLRHLNETRARMVESRRILQALKTTIAEMKDAQRQGRRTSAEIHLDERLPPLG